MIRLFYNSAFEKMGEIRTNDTWYVGNDNANEIKIYLMSNSNAFPTLTLLTSDNRQIFPIIGNLVNESSFVYNDKVYTYNSDTHLFWSEDENGEMDDSLDIYFPQDNDLNEYSHTYTFKLSSKMKQIVREGSMTIQVVINKGSNDGDFTNDVFRKTIDSIVVNVKKGYWETAKVFVSSETAIDDISARVMNAQQVAIASSRLSGENRGEITNIKNHLSSYQRNVPLEGTPLSIGTKIVDDRVFIKASNKDKQGVTLGIVGDNITFAGDDDLTDARNVPTSATSYHSKKFQFGIYDDGEHSPQQTNTSYFAINGYKWDDARNTWTPNELFKVNNVNDFITMHPRTFYAETEKFEVYGYDGDAYIPTTDYSVTTKAYVDTEIDGANTYTDNAITKLTTDEITPTQNRVSALEKTFDGTELYTRTDGSGTKYLKFNKDIELRDRGVFKTLRVNNVLLEDSAKNDRDAIRKKEFDAKVVEIQNEIDGDISTFGTNVVSPIKTSIGSLSLLTTSNKSSIVNAINELVTKDSTHATEYTKLRDKVNTFLNLENYDGGGLLDTLAELIEALTHDEKGLKALLDNIDTRVLKSDFETYESNQNTKNETFTTSITNIDTRVGSLETDMNAFKNDSRIMYVSKKMDEDTGIITIEYNLPILENGLSYDSESGILTISHQ